MHTTERQRLVLIMSAEPAYALGVVLKCGVCLALLILVAVIGTAGENAEVAQAARKGALPSASVVNTASAAAHRKEVFDARRANFSGTGSRHDIAGPTPAARAGVDLP